MDKNKEYAYKGFVVSGFIMLIITFVIIPILFILLLLNFEDLNIVFAYVSGVVLAFLFFIGCGGYFIQEPNEARVMIFFGKYCGTSRHVGFYWVNPFMNRKKLSLRIRNMDIEPIKVNDKIGNPVLIGMVLVWKIKDTYKVIFDVDSKSLGATGTSISNVALEKFVRIQSDAALREVTGHFAYDQTDNDTDELTLRDAGEKISELLEIKINERLAMAGMEVVEARINYLAYAPEIAAVMLRRQQASAIITAREKIVEGAVSMVDMAVRRIEEKGIVKLTDEKKSDMVSNLMVVLCSDEPATPIINAN